MLTLRHLVNEAAGIYAPQREQMRLLAYYANSIAHLFAAPSSARSGKG